MGKTERKNKVYNAGFKWTIVNKVNRKIREMLKSLFDKLPANATPLFHLNQGVAIPTRRISTVII